MTSTFIYRYPILTRNGLVELWFDFEPAVSDIIHAIEQHPRFATRVKQDLQREIDYLKKPPFKGEKFARGIDRASRNTFSIRAWSKTAKPQTALAMPS